MHLLALSTFFLPLHLLLAAPTTASSLPEVLTPQTFQSTVSQEGLWFVEHFSPWCGHCRSFLPTWEKLYYEVDKDAASEPKSGEAVRLRQVDCSVHGDLCNKHGINGYPTLQLYRAGELVGTFNSARDWVKLLDYIEKHRKHEEPESVPLPADALDTPAVASTKSPRNYNPEGLSVALNDKTFAKAIEDADGKAFIKFYAPWCGHCKKMAPAWRTMAARMQNKLFIGEVDCEAHKSLCTSQGIGGFPTLMLYSAGSKIEYSGGRKMEPLVEFAERAILPSITSITATELTTKVKEDDVLYVLLTRRTAQTTIPDALEPLVAPLLSQPSVYHVQSQSNGELFHRYSIPKTAPWALVALRDGVDSEASAVFVGESLDLKTNEEERKRAAEWIDTHSLESVTILDRSTFQRVMNSKSKPLVVIVSAPLAMTGDVTAKLREVSQKWRIHVGASDRVGNTPDSEGRPVVFSYMDSEQWASWLQSMYSIPKYTEPLGPAGQLITLDDLHVVVADHDRLVYWDQTLTGQPLKLTNSAALFGSLEAVHAGQLSSIHSENIFERFARTLNTYMTAVESFVVNHPWKFILVLLTGLGLFILFLTRITREEGSTGTMDGSSMFASRHHHPLTGNRMTPLEREKRGRLD